MSEPKKGVKQSIYFSDQSLAEIREEAARLERSASWVVQQAIKRAMAAIKKLPSSTPPDRSVSHEE